MKNILIIIAGIAGIAGILFLLKNKNKDKQSQFQDNYIPSSYIPSGYISSYIPEAQEYSDFWENPNFWLGFAKSEGGQNLIEGVSEPIFDLLGNITSGFGLF